jgi:hypothetical protein
MPAGDTKNPRSEEDLLCMARCLFSFSSGRLIPKDDKIAARIELDLEDYGEVGFDTAVHHAAVEKDLVAVQFFLNKGGNPTVIWDGDQQHALDHAIQNKDQEITRILLNHVPDEELNHLKYIKKSRSYPQSSALDLLRDRIKSSSMK